ncbi:MAG: UDP-N-acetylmuramate dehydrogenase [Christensenellaceae bacterium]|nr:UDP-N-acetylmuramate dehydrogenase [Christensenellaceae bacterium]
MLSKKIYEKINTLIETKDIVLNANMAKYCTLKLGGNVTALVNVSDEKQIIHAISIAKEFGLPYHIIGNGSNIFVYPEKYNAVIIKISKNMANISIEGDILIVQGGTSLALLSQKAMEFGLSGLEFAVGIPGTIGGAVYMNAGAYGSEIKDVLIRANTISENGDVFVRTNEELDFKYRYSKLQNNNEIVISASFKLEKGDSNAIKALGDGYKAKRIATQPIGIPSCGSTFKRPINNIAAKLIDECGLKGYRIGGCSVSKKHAGFLVNDNNGTADDYYKLIMDVRNIVLQKTGIYLDTEVQILGG